jgi:hypothetical protein
MLREEALELDLAEVDRRHRARDDDLLHLVVAPGQRRLQRRHQCARRQHSLRTRVLEHVGVVVGGEQRVHGHRHDAGMDGAEEGHRPVGAVQHQQQHALLAPDAERAQARGAALHALGKTAVAQAAGIVDERSLVGPAGVGLEQMLGEVERGRRWRHAFGQRGRRHAR